MEATLLLGLATSTMLGRSAEIFTMYHATPALTAPMPTRRSRISVIKRSFKIEKDDLFFFFPFFLGG